MANLEGIVKGDNINLEADLDQDITGWKIRCEIYDSCHCIKLATTNSGGSDDQIEITDATKGQFIIKVAKNETTDFECLSHIEIEGETSDEEIHTIHQGDINFKKERITWEDPTE